MPMGCCVFVLALSIFGWGLHSKLSLYSHVTEAQASAPIAKLLSEQERPSDHQTQIAHPEPVTLDAVVTSVALAYLPSSVKRLRSLENVSPVRPVAFSFDGPSSLRPPPPPVA